MPAKGRKKFEVTPAVLKKVESLASKGMTHEQIAYCLGICVATLSKQKRINAQFLGAIKKGQAKGIEVVTNKLFQNAKSGDNTSIIFYLKNRAGWSDKVTNEHTGQDGGPIKIERVIVDPNNKT